MNFSTLSAADKNAVIASVVTAALAIVSLVSDWGGLMVIPLLGAIGMLVVVFGPSMMPNTKLPGSKGSLLLVAGGAAAIFWVIDAISWLDYITSHLATFDVLQFLVGLVAALWMGLIGWQAFQGEGGTFNVGMSGGASAAPPAPPAYTPPAPAAPMPPAPPVQTEESAGSSSGDEPQA